MGPDMIKVILEIECKSWSSLPSLNDVAVAYFDYIAARYSYDNASEISGILGIGRSTYYRWLEMAGDQTRAVNVNMTKERKELNMGMSYGTGDKRLTEEAAKEYDKHQSTRQCTCPAGKRPEPCQHKFALTECKLAFSEAERKRLCIELEELEKLYENEKWGRRTAEYPWPQKYNKARAKALKDAISAAKKNAFVEAPTEMEQQTLSRIVDSIRALI
jgi:hypothetical protein